MDILIVDTLTRKVLAIDLLQYGLDTQQYLERPRLILFVEMVEILCKLSLTHNVFLQYHQMVGHQLHQKIAFGELAVRVITLS